MKSSDKNKNSLIDEFYNESQEEKYQRTAHSEVDLEFKRVLSSTAKKMDVLNDDIFDFDIDTISIIEQGEYIREKRKTNKEFLLFIVSSFIILSLYAILIIKTDSKILIISQVLIASIAPWIIIPVVVIKKKGSEA